MQSDLLREVHQAAVGIKFETRANPPLFPSPTLFYPAIPILASIIKVGKVPRLACQF